MNKKAAEYPGVLWFQGMDWVLKAWKKNPKLTKRQIGVWYSWKADTKENNQPLSESYIKGLKQTFKRWKRK